MGFNSWTFWSFASGSTEPGGPIPAVVPSGISLQRLERWSVEHELKVAGCEIWDLGADATERANWEIWWDKDVTCLTNKTIIDLCMMSYQASACPKFVNSKLKTNGFPPCCGHDGTSWTDLVCVTWWWKTADHESRHEWIQPPNACHFFAVFSCLFIELLL